MHANLVRIELLLTRKDVEAIDQTVQEGQYATRTDAIRTAVRRQIMEEKRQNLKKTFELIDKRLKEKGMDPQELIEEFGRRSSEDVEELIRRAKTKPTHR